MTSVKYILILLTDVFPYGDGESFLETEISFLADRFDKIIVVNSIADGKKRQMPGNCFHIFSPELAHNTAHRISKKIVCLFTSDFWHEVFYLVFFYRMFPTVGRMKKCLKEMFEGHVLFHQLKSIVAPIVADKKTKVVLYSYWSSSKAYAVSLVKKNYSKKIIGCSRSHGWDLYFERSPVGYLPFRRFIADRLDAIFFISEHGKCYFSHKIKCNKEKLKVSRLGVIGGPCMLPYTCSEKFRIVTCSNIHPVKRLDFFVKALAEIIDFQVEWLHFGTGTDIERIIGLAEIELGNKNNLSYRFMGGVSNKNVLNYYDENNVDLFVNVSSSEGIPVSIMEAMAVGIPVLALDVGGVGEIVDSSNGLLLPADSPPAMVAHGLQEFMKMDFEEYLECRSNAFRTWSQKYNAVDNYSSFVEEIFTLAVGVE